MKYLGAPQSGSQANTTASRNRNGQYYRNRSIPVNPNSLQQQIVRNRLSVTSAAWESLTDAQRAGWATLGALMPRVDSLGQSGTLTGFQAYVSVNTNNGAAGAAAVSDAPAFTSPPVLLTATVTLTHTAFSIAYTTTPLAAGIQLFVYVSPPQKAGRSFNKQYKLIGVTAAAAASPANMLTAYSSRFGAPVAGYREFIRLCLFENGFVGQPFEVAQLIA